MPAKTVQDPGGPHLPSLVEHILGGTINPQPVCADKSFGTNMVLALLTPLTVGCWT